MSKKNLPWSGWSYEKPGTHEKTVMKLKCGKKCFLGPGKSFPICKKNTCNISSKGIYSAYIRALEWKNKRSTYLGRSTPKYSRSTYNRIATRAKNLLLKKGFSSIGNKKTLKNIKKH